MSEIKTALSPAQYWEWRTTISEREVAQEKLRTASLELNLLQKEAEVLAVRTQLFVRTRLELAKAEAGSAHAEYARFKGELEKDLGQSLNNKLIDDTTYEIRDAPEQQTTLAASSAVKGEK